MSFRDIFIWALGLITLSCAMSCSKTTKDKDPQENAVDQNDSADPRNAPPATVDGALPAPPNGPVAVLPLDPPPPPLPVPVPVPPPPPPPPPLIGLPLPPFVPVPTPVHHRHECIADADCFPEDSCIKAKCENSICVFSPKKCLNPGPCERSPGFCVDGECQYESACPEPLGKCDKYECLDDICIHTLTCPGKPCTNVSCDEETGACNESGCGCAPNSCYDGNDCDAETEICEPPQPLICPTQTDCTYLSCNAVNGQCDIDLPCTDIPPCFSGEGTCNMDGTCNFTDLTPVACTTPPRSLPCHYPCLL